MLPALFLYFVGGLGLSALYSGCAHRGGKKDELPKPDPILAFTPNDHPLAFNLYQKIIRGGVSPKVIDRGYNVANYSQKYCSDKSQRNCEVGKGDGKIEAEEVLEYCLDHEASCRTHLEAELKRPVPWGLNDFDPKTDFDAKIRKKVQDNIDYLHPLIERQGFKKGSPEYEKRMAVGLCGFVSINDKKNYEENKDLYGDLNREMDELGLKEYREYITKHGGLRPLDQDYEERDALGALKSSQGKCTEISAILFSVLQMAGLKPFFILVNPGKTKMPLIQEFFQSDPLYLHVAIGINIQGKDRLLDASLLRANTPHDEYYPLSKRQFFALHLTNSAIYEGYKISRGMKKGKDQYFKLLHQAKLFDSAQPFVYLNQGNPYFNKGQPQKVLSLFQKVQELYPQLLNGYFVLGEFYFANGQNDLAFKTFSKANEIHPGIAVINYKIGNVIVGKENYKDPHVLRKALPYFLKATEIDPKEINYFLALGTTQSLLGLKAEAINTYDRAIKLVSPREGWIKNPNQETREKVEPHVLKLAKAYLGRGILYASNDIHDRAIHDFNQGLHLAKKDPSLYPELIYFRSVAYGKKGDLINAKKDLLAYVKTLTQINQRNLEKVASAFSEIYTAPVNLRQFETQQKLVEKDTGLDFHRIKVFLLAVDLLVEAGYSNEAKYFAKEFIPGIIQTKKEIHRKRKPISSTTRKWFNQIFQQLPPTLQKDPSIRQLWK